MSDSIGERFGGIFKRSEKPRRELDRKSIYDSDDPMADLAQLLSELKALNDLLADENESEPNLEYKVFKSKAERDEIVEIGRETCRYMKENNITQVGIMDRSARPAYITILENWKQMYPDEESPKIYFINPKGFVSSEIIDNNPSKPSDDMFESWVKRDREEGADALRSQSQIETDLRTTFPDITSNEAGPVLLFDTCIHSGDSFRPVVDTMKGMGVDVRVGVVSSDSGNRSGITPDFIVMDRTPKGVCYPFDKDRLVDKTYTSVHALRAEDDTKKELSRQIRREVRRAVTEHYSS